MRSWKVILLARILTKQFNYNTARMSIWCEQIHSEIPHVFESLGQKVPCLDKLHANQRRFVEAKFLSPWLLTSDKARIATQFLKSKIMLIIILCHCCWLTHNCNTNLNLFCQHWSIPVLFNLVVNCHMCLAIFILTK